MATADSPRSRRRTLWLPIMAAVVQAGWTGMANAEGSALLPGIQWGMSRDEVAARLPLAVYAHPWASGTAFGQPVYSFAGQEFALALEFAAQAGHGEGLRAVDLFVRGDCHDTAYDKAAAAFPADAVIERGKSTDHPNDRNMVIATPSSLISLILDCSEENADFRFLTIHEQVRKKL